MKTKLALRLSVILPLILASGYVSAEVLEGPFIEGNVFSCPLAGPGSQRIVVVIQDNALDDLAKQLKKKKDIPADSRVEAMNWIPKHTPCNQPVNGIKVSEICFSSTYQCSYEKSKGLGTSFTGPYHGILTLGEKDLKDLTGGWDNLMGRFKKDGTLGTRVHDALNNLSQRSDIPDNVRETLPGGTRNWPDPWATSACLQQFVNTQHQYPANNLHGHSQEEKLKNFDFSSDYIEEQCGQIEGEKEYEKRDAENKHQQVLARLQPVGDLQTVNTYKATPGCERIQPNDGTVKPTAAGCEYARKCVSQIFENTCKDGCNMSQCLNDYRTFCNDAPGCKIGEKASSHASGNSLTQPDVATITGDAISALGKVSNDNDLMTCGLREYWLKIHKGNDPNSEEEIKKGCEGDDLSLAFLQKVLLTFNNDATGDKPANSDSYRARADNFQTFDTLKTFVSAFASSGLPMDSDLRKNLKELSKDGGFLDWVQQTHGGSNYLGHDHSKPAAAPKTSAVNTRNPLEVFKKLDNASIPTSCLKRFNVGPEQGDLQDYVMWMMKFDYNNALWMNQLINVDCKSIGSSPASKSKSSGR